MEATRSSKANPTFFENYVDGMSRCEFRYKFPTLLVLCILLFFTLIDFTPDVIRYCTGGLCFVISLLMGILKS